VIEKAKFWTSSWVGRRTPKSMAPILFKKSKRKNITVQKALQDKRWIAHITPLLTSHEIIEYVSLWEAVGHTQLHEDNEDTIYWHWTEDGEYTAKSAYCVQF
jgi:hypothetical protein